MKTKKPAKRRASAGERIMMGGRIPVNRVDDLTLWDKRCAARIDRAIRAKVKDAAHCEREFVYDALSDMGHDALCKQLRERINKHTRKYGAKP